MLKQFFSLTISLIIVITGLIFIHSFIPSLESMTGFQFAGENFMGITYSSLILLAPGFIFFAWLALVSAPFITNALFDYAEQVAKKLSKIPTAEIFVMVLGVGIGLIIANLLGSSLARVPVIGPYVSIVLSFVMAIVGARLAAMKRKDIINFFNRVTHPKSKDKEIEELEEENGPLADELASSNKLLDTSVIIDGRIMDILAAGFLDGRLVVPNFVIAELQRLSDSADNMKRAKGRRGLDMIHDMQTNYKDRVAISNKDYEDIPEVDSKLVRLAKESGAVLMTNDYNLHKVAEIQGVTVLNINELANAIKPVVLPGEELQVYLVKEGKELNQAIAYLDDGTMIVVENGQGHIGGNVTIIVNSMLQTAAGRMIFARVK
ncbi:MAG: PIN/TRAM domain-containing protein [Phascolarctobacterium sp.]|nr:PIN/TRAM domain-containing protein [Phascolarctobacterium sp.]